MEKLEQAKIETIKTPENHDEYVELEKKRQRLGEIAPVIVDFAGLYSSHEEAQAAIDNVGRLLEEYDKAIVEYKAGHAQEFSN